MKELKPQLNFHRFVLKITKVSALLRSDSVFFEHIALPPRIGGSWDGNKKRNAQQEREYKDMFKVRMYISCLLNVKRVCSPCIYNTQPVAKLFLKKN